MRRSVCLTLQHFLYWAISDECRIVFVKIDFLFLKYSFILFSSPRRKKLTNTCYHQRRSLGKTPKAWLRKGRKSLRFIFKPCWPAFQWLHLKSCLVFCSFMLMWVSVFLLRATFILWWFVLDSSLGLPISDRLNPVVLLDCLWTTSMWEKSSCSSMSHSECLCCTGNKWNCCRIGRGAFSQRYCQGCYLPS